MTPSMTSSSQLSGGLGEQPVEQRGGIAQVSRLNPRTPVAAA
jgi:hypothetical protein